MTATRASNGRIGMLARAVVGAVLVLWLGKLIVTSALVQVALNEQQPELLGKLGVESPRLLAEMAGAAIGNEDYARAGELARKALVEAPGEPVAIRALGLSEDAIGDPQRAAAIMALSAKWGWRDRPTQAWLYQRLVINEDYATAAMHGDAILRQNPTFEPMFKAFAYQATTPGGRRALADLLAARPAWRKNYFAALVELEPQLVVSADALIRELATTAAPPTREEVIPFMGRTVQLRQANRGRALWFALFAPGQSPSPLYDGGFEAMASQLSLNGQDRVFEWATAYSANGYAEAMQRRGAQGSALQVSVSGVGNQRLAWQTLALQPGRYEVSGRYSVDDAEALRAVDLRVACYVGNRELGKLDSRAGVEPDRWHVFRFVVDVPAGSEGCTTQFIGFEGKASSPPREQLIWFDDLAIARQAAPMPASPISIRR